MAPFRIYRYIAREIAVPAVVGLLVFTFLLFMGRILRLVEMVVNKGVPFADILHLFVSLLPASLVITIPLSFLLGVLFGFGRLSTDSEIIALKASGFSLRDLLKPVLVLALVASIATGVLTLYLAPTGNSSFRETVFRIASSRATIGLQPLTFYDEFDGLLLYANAIDPRSDNLTGVLISDERLGNHPALILAREGRIVSDPRTRTLILRLRHGKIHRRVAGSDESYQVIDFSTYDINLEMDEHLPADDQAARKKTKEMSTAELRATRDAETWPVTRRQYSASLYKRFARPFSPLLFTLVGAPLALQSRRSGRSGGFALGIALFLLYYLLLSLAETLAVEGGLPPAPTVWAPNILFLVAGLFFLRLASREQRLLPFSRLAGWFASRRSSKDHKERSS